MRSTHRHGRSSLLALAFYAAAAQSSPAIPSEAYVAVPMPPGFRVETSELEGPVFADAKGRTLYIWPSKKMRNGYSGEMKGKPACYGEVRTVSAGLMSPYPPGLLLPELDKRPSCAQLWPPVLAQSDSKPIGNWTIVARTDGTRQWAYDEQPLYVSTLDRLPGDTVGGTRRKDNQEMPAVRVPVGPPPTIPPGFAVKATSSGRLLTTDRSFSVYAFDKDTADHSMCDADCARIWNPVLAPQTAKSGGEWATIERSPGVRQWTFRQKPLYTYSLSKSEWSFEGSDVPGWRNVYTQRAPPPPAGFTVQDTIMGQVLADRRGMTIYTYICGDDSVDQLSCDHPDGPQTYRIAVCGGGDADACLRNWPYVLADKESKGPNRAWTVMQIDPKTGHRAAPGQTGVLSVWAYRDRPVYTYAKDAKPGDINGDGTGEWRGWRNGLKAFWLRDNYYEGAL